MSSFTGADLSTIASILKEDYRDPIIELLNHKNILVSRIEATSEFTQGKRAYLPLHVGRNEGLGSRKEASSSTQSNLPSAGSQKYDDAVYGMRYHYGGVQFTGPAVAAARNNEGAFARLVDSEVQGMVRDAARDFNRQMFSPSSGEMSIVQIAPGGTSVDGSTTLSALQFEVTNGQFLRVNQYVDVILPVTGTVRNSAKALVTAVTPIPRSTDGVIFYRITVSGATLTSVTAADIVVRHDNYTTEMFGLADLISDANPAKLPVATADIFKYVGGIDRTLAANDHWKSNVINANAKFGDYLFRNAMDLSEREGDGSVSLFVTEYDIFNEYGNSLLPQRRYNTTGTPFGKLDGGWDMLDYNGVPVVKDRDCQPGKIWALAEDRLHLLQMNDWDWMDQDGSMLSRVQGKDAYEATLFRYCEFAISDPKDCVQIHNVAVN